MNGNSPKPRLYGTVEMNGKGDLAQEPKLTMCQRVGPSWLAKDLVATGESAACLALSGHYAVALTTSDIGKTIEYAGVTPMSPFTLAHM